MAEPNNNPGSEGEKTFTQSEVDAIVQARVDKLQKKYGDYASLKDKAAKYDEITESGKTDLQKANDRADALQKQLDEINKANSLKEVREKVAKETKVPVHLLTGEDEESCKAQAKAILEYAKPNSYPGTKKNEGSGHGGSDNAEYRELARAMFGGN